jgi:hypothetical protein
VKGLLSLLASIASLVGIVYLLFATSVLGAAFMGVALMFKATFAPCPTMECVGFPMDGFRLMFFFAIVAVILGGVLSVLTFRR